MNKLNVVSPILYTKIQSKSFVGSGEEHFKVLFSSPGLCPWRAYVVTQSLASASVGVHVGVRVSVCVGVRVSTVFKFSKVCIVF